MSPPPGALVLGAAQLGQRYGNGPDRSAPSAAAVADILHQASDLGVHDIDTARAYGNSEQAIGEAAVDLPDLRIVTKVAPLALALTPADRDNRVSNRDVEAAVRNSLAASLAALRRDSIDTLLLHRAADLTAGDGAAVQALQAAVDAGRARRWGASLSTPDELLAALSIPGLGYIQLPFNLLDRRWLADDIQHELSAHPQVHITVRSALLQGLLVGSDPARWPAIAGVDAVATIDRLRTMADRFGAADLLELAVRYVRGFAWVDSVVLGLRRPEQLSGLTDAVAAEPLDDDQLDLIHREIAGAPLDLIDPSRWPGLAAVVTEPTVPTSRRSS